MTVDNPRRAFDPFAPHLDAGEPGPAAVDPAESIRALLAGGNRVTDDGDPAASIRRLLNAPLDTPQKSKRARTARKTTTAKPAAGRAAAKPATGRKPAARKTTKKES